MVTLDKRVLVVDDEEIVRESYKRALTEAGYNVRTVESGSDALEACRAESFDVMLTDLKMPEMDGVEIAQAMKQEFPDVRVVIITGYPTRSSADRAAQLGIFDYLEKPLSPERLSAATAEVLSRPVPVAEPTVAAVETEQPAAMPQEEKVAAHPKVKLAVLTAVGFLVGVTVCYAIAPSQGLAYLAVGTAIASGTVLGLFSDMLSPKHGVKKSV
jgi:DNA-binding NtrC family response regulator